MIRIQQRGILPTYWSGSKFLVRLRLFTFLSVRFFGGQVALSPLAAQVVSKARSVAGLDVPGAACLLAVPVSL